MVCLWIFVQSFRVNTVFQVSSIVTTAVSTAQVKNHQLIKFTVFTLTIGTNRPKQTVWTQIRHCKMQHLGFTLFASHPAVLDLSVDSRMDLFKI